MYSASIVERAICICNLDAQATGQPAYAMAHPERDFEVVGSIPAILQWNPPVKQRQPNIHNFYHRLAG